MIELWVAQVVHLSAGQGVLLIVLSVGVVVLMKIKKGDSDV